jgi:hypothetical protein
LGKCLRAAEETTGKSIDEIRALIDEHISDLRDTFTSDAPYPEKNKQILALRAFYNEIRDPITLVNFIRSNESSLGLR